MSTRILAVWKSDIDIEIGDSVRILKMTTITIRNEDIRPLFLAVVYALSLPRKTIDRERLVNLQQQLQSDFSKATCTLNLEPEEILLLGGALNGVINEMKQEN